MPEKLTLTSYLARRGKGNALTRIEAEAFGIDYPLISGWPARHGTMEITEAMIEQLELNIEATGGGAARRARRGLDAVEGVVVLVPAAKIKQKKVMKGAAPAPAAAQVSPVPGFALRQARRYRARKMAPWS